MIKGFAINGRGNSVKVSVSFRLGAEDEMIKIDVVCATGIATSSMMKVKVQQFLEDHGFRARITPRRVAELSLSNLDCDLILATTDIPPEIAEHVPVIPAISLITGIGKEEVYEKLLEFFEKAKTEMKA